MESNSQLIYRDLIESLRDVIYSTDNRGIITYLSPSIKTIGGYDPVELAGSDYSCLFHEEDRPRLAERLAGYASGEIDPAEFEARLLLKNRDFRWVRIAIHPIDAGVDFRGIRGIISDITESKLALEALRESEERYRAVWENSPVGICLTDREGIFRYVNPAYCRIYGFAANELIGRPFYEILAPEHSSQDARQKHRNIFDSGLSIPLGETEFSRKDGGRVWVEYTADFVRKEGKPAFLASMNVDITERKKAEFALRESEERFRLLVDNAQDSILSVDEDGTVLMLNKKASEYLGGMPNDLKGRSILELFPVHAAENRMRLIARAIRQNSVVLKEEVVVFGKARRWFQTYFLPVHCYWTGKMGVQIISRDITDEKKKSVRTSARFRLLERLREAENAGQCLEYGGNAILESMYFKRLAYILFGDDDTPPAHGQIDASETMLHFMGTVVPGKNFLAYVAESGDRISQSYLLEQDRGKKRATVPRVGIRPPVCGFDAAPQNESSLLLTPMFGNDGMPMGWICAASAAEQTEELEAIISGVEEIVDLVTEHIREIRGRIRLHEERLALENSNVTLTEVLAGIEEEKEEVLARVRENINKVVMPLLEKVDAGGKLNRAYFDQLKTNLKSLASSPEQPRRNIAGLTSRELEICALIKTGHTNAVIARTLRISPGTVRKHREAIRGKLGLHHRNVNLTTFLKNM